MKDSWDVSGGGVTSEFLYETMAVTGNASRWFFSAGANDCQDVWYSDWPTSSAHLFGCVSVKHKQYCILNRQYSKEEYGMLISKIKKHMEAMPYKDKRGRMYGFGEFFPMELSAYAYNESYAFPWYKAAKKDVLSEGLGWRDMEQRSYTTTIKSKDLPDHIQDADDSILEAIIGCAHEEKCNDRCTSAFRISRAELEFYRYMNIALPRLCPNCRNAERITWRNGFDLYSRGCMCDRQDHFHGSGGCPNQFETTFSPSQQEIVFCADCYKADYL